MGNVFFEKFKLTFMNKIMFGTMSVEWVLSSEINLFGSFIYKMR